MSNIEVLKELYKEEIGILIKTDIYKIVERLKILNCKEEILKTLDLHDKSLVESLPRTLRSKIDDLKVEDQIINYIGTWGELNPRKESKRLMDMEVYNLREEREGEKSKIEEKQNSEIRAWYYIYAKVQKIKELLAKEGVISDVNSDGTIAWIEKK